MTNTPLAMIIEDDESLAGIFSIAVEQADFAVEIIASGEVALSRLKEVVPALIILDLHLPNVSGVTILQRIRADHRLAETRVILATADAQTASSLEGEADLILIKPISFGQLRDFASRLHPSSSVIS